MIFCLAVWLLAAMAGSVRAATLTIDGSQTYQVIDGFGVNANHRSWTNNELVPVLDALIDEGGMTLFHVIFDNSNWEAVNDNSDPNVMNWDYYNGVYSAPDFQKLWGIMAYLNQRGITNGLVPDFEGPVALWMGGLSLTPGYEDEYAETIASLLVYARYTEHLQFTVVGPVNEPDITYTGINMPGGAIQYVTVMHDLAQQLDNNGLSDVRFSGPDLACTSTAWLGTIMNDPVVMAKFAHFGLHSYLNETRDTTGVYTFLQHSVYPDSHFWMTEFNVWCQSCASGGGGDNSWAYARGTASFLLNLLAEGASAGIVWEGYDSEYVDFDPTTGGNKPPHWSYWGLFAVDDTNAVVKTYTPRKGFYTLAQIAKFVRPGAQRVEASGSSTPLTVLAFYNTNNGQFTLTGINTDSIPAALTGTLTSLPTISGLELYYTDSTTNLLDSATVAVTNGGFVATVPADSVFTLVGTNTPATPVSASGTTFSFGPPVAPVWDVSGSYQVTNHAQGAKLAPLDVVFQDLALTVDGHGHLQGPGVIQVLAGDDGFMGDCRLSGSVSGGGSSTRVNFSVRFKGSGVVSNVPTSCTIAANYKLGVDSTSRTLIGKVSGNAYFSDRRTGSLKSDVSLPLPSGADGGWSIGLDVSQSGTKLTGTGVVRVDGASGSALLTRVSGNVPRNSATAKVKLSGSGASSGTQLNLQYIPAGGTSNPTATVNGKVLGQKVKN
jgi:O-glycosyl hydrolase